MTTQPIGPQLPLPQLLRPAPQLLHPLPRPCSLLLPLRLRTLSALFILIVWLCCMLEERRCRCPPCLAAPVRPFRPMQRHKRHKTKEANHQGCSLCSLKQQRSESTPKQRLQQHSRSPARMPPLRLPLCSPMLSSSPPTVLCSTLLCSLINNKTRIMLNMQKPSHPDRIRRSNPSSPHGSLSSRD
jgi:hypothetical protein